MGGTMQPKNQLLLELISKRLSGLQGLSEAVLLDTAEEAERLMTEVQPYRAQLGVSDAPFDFEAQLQAAWVR